MLKFNCLLACRRGLIGIGLVFALVACKETAPLESPVIMVTFYPVPTLQPVPTATPMPVTPAAQAPEQAPTSEIVFTPTPEPTRPPEWEEIGSTAIRTLKSGTRLVLQNVNLVEAQRRLMSRNRMIRGNRAYWLTTGAAFTKRFGYSKYEFSGYFCATAIEDLDLDDEPELIIRCEQGGLIGIGSIHIYAWQRGAYRLILESAESNIRYELVNTDSKDRSPKIVVRYNYAPSYDNLMPWANVYSLRKGRMVDISSTFPAPYVQLLIQLRQLEAQNQQNLSNPATQDGAAWRLAEIHQKIATAEAILVQANKANE